jgi:hypothetical protein
VKCDHVDRFAMVDRKSEYMAAFAHLLK